jgi:hypothetical protein
MTYEGLAKMFEGEFADICPGNLLLMCMRGRAEGLACKDLEARIPISVKFYIISLDIADLLFIIRILWKL